MFSGENSIQDFTINAELKNSAFSHKRGSLININNVMSPDPRFENSCSSNNQLRGNDSILNSLRTSAKHRVLSRDEILQLDMLLTNTYVEED